MTKPKAINRKKLVAFVLPIIRKEKLPMSEELELPFSHNGIEFIDIHEFI